MPSACMASIEALGVDAIQLAHAGGEIPLRGLNQQMVMVVHQAVGVAPPMVTLHDVRQDGEKRQAIGVIAVLTDWINRRARVMRCRDEDDYGASSEQTGSRARSQAISLRAIPLTTSVALTW